MLDCDSYAKVLMVNPTNVTCAAAACTDVECCVDRLTLFTVKKKRGDANNAVLGFTHMHPIMSCTSSIIIIHTYINLFVCLTLFCL